MKRLVIIGMIIPVLLLPLAGVIGCQQQPEPVPPTTTPAPIPAPAPPTPTPSPAPGPTPAAAPPTPPTPEPTPEETPQPVSGSDGRLRIVVDKIERWSDAYHATRSQELPFGVRSLQPGEGVDAIVIYLTVTPLQDFCAGMEMLMDSLLTDTDGNECEVQSSAYYAFMPWEPGSPCRGFFEETTVELYFPFPEYATPAKVRFIYSFLEPGQDKSV